MYRHFPIFIKDEPSEENLWDVTFSKMFNMGSDAHLFRLYSQLEADNWSLKGNVFYKDGEICLPLYEGKMISYFDHRFNSYNQQRVVETYDLSDTQHADPSFLPS